MPQAVRAAWRWLLAAQKPDGHWCGELEGDTILESEYVLVLHFLGRLDDPRVRKAARYLRGRHLDSGGWAIYPGGPPEVSASVKAYLALKLAGDDPGAPHMRLARKRIRELGGIEACNSFTKIYLAICGQYDWWRCPAVPPEMILLPRWVYFNIYEISSWSRAIVVPLSVIWALRPVRPVPAGTGIDELLVEVGLEGNFPASRGWVGASPSPPAPPGRDPAVSESREGDPRGDVGGDPIDALSSPPHPHRSAVSRGRIRRLRLRRQSRRRGSRIVLGGGSPFWRGLFHLLDLGLKAGERLRLTPFRKRALARAEAWVLERLEGSDGLGAIFPPIVNTIFALSCLGYEDDHPAVRGQLAELERLEIEEDGSLRLQPCFSAIWDTALAVASLTGSGLPADHPALHAAQRWLIEHEVTRTGDWSRKTHGAAPGGWCFEYRNPFYPDSDDTAQVLIALAALPGGGQAPAVRRGLAWLLAMQNEDGGWGAFDRGCDKQVLTHVPFADHNALLDPSTADVTARVLDCLGRLGLPRDHRAVAGAIAFLRREQEPDGTWYGRWGCNYIYGTWLALSGLASFDAVAGEDWCERAAGWLLAHQNADGGWGESPLSYDDPAHKGIGPSTAAQTAWALMALAAAGIRDGSAVDGGVDYLLRTQCAGGCWHDEPWTGTGFPRVFYLRYHLYATLFPLLALAQNGRNGEDGNYGSPADGAQGGPPHAFPHEVPAPAAPGQGA